MKLLSIGRSKQADIVMNSVFVSSFHAELLQLDNGDMLLIDRESSNGTFVNGIRIAPDKEVAVTRRDDIRIADQPLNWSVIPELPVADMKDIKTIINIGTHSMNAYRVNGKQISRFHATIKQLKNGKWYICDHSSNGTTLNGVRLPKDRYMPLKSGDSIACAGVSIKNPVKDGGRKVPTVIAAVVCACLLIGVAAWAVVRHSDIYPIAPPVTPEKIYSTYSSSTVLLTFAYYYRIKIEGVNTERWVIRDDGFLEEYNGHNAIWATATGFFISDNGAIVTNLHVVKPWLFDGSEQILKNKFYYYYYQGKRINISRSDVKIDGVLDRIYAYPNGCYFDGDNCLNCRVVIASPSTDVDLAILQTATETMPQKSSFVKLSSVKSENVPVGVEITTMGFPFGDGLQDMDTRERFVEKSLQAVSSVGVVTQNNDKYNYGFDAASWRGASGSPIFDKDGYLIGVVCSGKVASQGYNFGVKSKYILRLLKDAEEELGLKNK